MCHLALVAGLCGLAASTFGALYSITANRRGRRRM